MADSTSPRGFFGPDDIRRLGLPPGLVGVYVGQPEFTFGGPDAAIFIDMIIAVFQYVIDEQMDDFAAYAEKHGDCECGEPATHRANIEKHLTSAIEKLEAMLGRGHT